MYKKQMRAIWTTEEIDFTKDYKDFITLDENKQHTVKMILSFFSNSDGLVNYNIRNNFLNDFCTEISYVYTFQMFMENIHNEVYSLMIDNIIRDKEEKDKVVAFRKGGSNVVETLDENKFISKLKDEIEKRV